jgi:predicted DNA-binding ribbon-helix-helix protein
VVKHGKAKSGSLARTGTSLVSRNLVICGRKTTVRLEDEMWESLKDVAEREGCSVNALGSRIYRQKKSDESFTSAIRISLMLYYRDAAREAGHAEAGRPRILPRATRRGKRLPERRPPGVAAVQPAEEIDGALRCIETGNPDEWS